MKLSQVTILAAGIVLAVGAGQALAAGPPQVHCQQLEREYSQLQQKEQNGTATPADKRRMKQIDDQTNIYCN